MNDILRPNFHFKNKGLFITLDMLLKLLILCLSLILTSIQSVSCIAYT